MFFVGFKNLFPILLLQSLIISSIFTFSIPSVVPKSSLIVYSINLLFITNSRLLNFFRSKIIWLFAFFCIQSCVSTVFSRDTHISSNAFCVTLFNYSLSSVATSDNLFIVFNIFGLNSFFIYGITQFLTLFLV